MEEMHESESWERNADNNGLGPIGDVRHAWDFNGSGAEEFSEFHPTRHELITLAKYWAETAIEEDYKRFLHSCSFETMLWIFSWMRVDLIRYLLGVEIDVVVDEAYRAVGEKKDKKEWETFRHESAAFHASARKEAERRLARPR